ncbi:MAG: repair protein RecN [Actinomycetota bacterium]|jgi:DNA repair protein RecN (Recombination protein N)|nr:repair protein RecN [Actinomycetota bacterium]
MLIELSVRQLGVIDELALRFGVGMTALTGETGAGKTLVVEALDLVLGGRADGLLVRPGADEAWVEARFEDGDDERILARAVPAEGRSRAYVDGRMAPASALAEAGAGLVDLHGQHAHQSLLAPAVQRAALDRFANIDLAPLTDARQARRAVEEALAALGGDARARAREIDLVGYQVAELEDARLEDAEEDDRLAVEEEALADATAHREAAGSAAHMLAGDEGAAEAIGAALGELAGRAPFAEVEARLRSAAAEVSEAAADLRAAGESLQDDPERLAAVRARRQLLHDLRRKYGAGLADVIAFRDEAGRRLTELEGFEERAADLERERAACDAEVAAAEAAVGAHRRRAAPELATSIEAHLQVLAMPRARFAVEVDDDDPGDEVAFLLGANPGEPALPLAKTASGGELARAMLAARLVLTDAPGTLVFDEVDAGIGGEAAVAVGQALADLAVAHQVIVVTHLPQVAAFADHQIAVTKHEEDGRTVTRVRVLDDAGRVVELSRMLSGQPDSATARGHAEELLASARERSR